jgi:hypothetical protein
MRRLSLLVLTACGRIGYDHHGAATDGGADAAPDAPLVCPDDTTEVSPGASTCIEKAQRGSTTWVASDAACRALARRLCTGVEWNTGCKMAVGMTDRTDDYEWAAENDGVNANKWGSGSCDELATHPIDSGDYGYRCCAAKH